MKKVIVLTVLFFLSVSLLAQPPKGPAKKGTGFGAKITVENAITPDAVPALLEGKQSTEVKVKGTVVEVCKAEGCWIRMQTPAGNMLIKMKDHSFAVPLALNGKTIIAEGTATLKETSVETLKHYAEDAGKSKEEIEAIKEPKKEIVLQATGILVVK